MTRLTGNVESFYLRDHEHQTCYEVAERHRCRFLHCDLVRSVQQLLQIAVVKRVRSGIYVIHLSSLSDRELSERKDGEKMPRKCGRGEPL